MTFFFACCKAVQHTFLGSDLYHEEQTTQQQQQPITLYGVG